MSVSALRVVGGGVCQCFEGGGRKCLSVMWGWVDGYGCVGWMGGCWLGGAVHVAFAIAKLVGRRPQFLHGTVPVLVVQDLVYVVHIPSEGF